ncbi:hypothetical protein B0H14DRAFT_1471587 [Mycena olivaceomarginata]|nr:hypothetical protein B0H14DRAFT_1471587 [Mycena olivaceomarginata]
MMKPKAEAARDATGRDLDDHCACHCKTADHQAALSPVGQWSFPPEIRGEIFLAFLPVLSDSAILSVGSKPCLPPVAGVGASVSQVVSQVMVFNWRRADRFRVWNLSGSTTTHLPTGFSPKAGQRSRPIPSAGAASLRFLDALKCHCGRSVRNPDYASSPSRLAIRLLCGYNARREKLCGLLLRFRWPHQQQQLRPEPSSGASAQAPPGSPSEPRSQSRSRSRTRPFAPSHSVCRWVTQI